MSIEEGETTTRYRSRKQPSRFWEDGGRSEHWAHSGDAQGKDKGEGLAQVTCRFYASLKHKDDGQTKFIKPNSQRQDIIIKYWVSIGSIHREQG